MGWERAHGDKDWWVSRFIVQIQLVLYFVN